MSAKLLTESLAKAIPPEAARRIIEFLNRRESGQVLMDVRDGRICSGYINARWRVNNESTR